MKKTKEDFGKMSEKDLSQAILVEKERLTKLKFAHAISPLQNAMEIRTQRRHVARLLTELNSRTQA